MPAPPGTVVELVVRLGVELVVGFVLGFLMQLCAAIVQAGGEIIDAQMGLTMAQIYDASSQANMSVTASLLNILFFSELLCRERPLHPDAHSAGLG